MAKKKRRQERERVVRPPEIKRPLPVTIIAWILIIQGVLSIPAVVFGFNDPRVLEVMSHVPLPIGVQWFMTIAGLTVLLVSGRGILRAENWARWLYIGFSGVALIFNFAIAEHKVLPVPAILVFVIISACLLSPPANKYFNVKS